MLTINQTEKRQLDWVEGALPRDWALKRGRTLYTRVREEPKPEDSIVTAFRDGQVTLRENRRTDGFTNAVKEHGYQRVREGDLVIHSMDGFAGAIGVSDSHGKCSPVYVVCEPHNASCPRYHAYVLRHMAIFGYITSLAKGIRERSTAFGWSEFRDEYLPVPPLPTQKAIANFLDRKTAAIDALIEKKEKLLELLAEKRSALINQAVTKGLDPNVPMKDSGIPWIGEIPEHWAITRASRLCSGITKGATPSAQSKAAEREYPVPFLRVNNLNFDGTMDLGELRFIQESIHNGELGRSKVKPGDILINIVGPPLGKVAVVPDRLPDSNINQAIAFYRCKNVEPGFFTYWLQSDFVKSWFWLNAKKTSGQANLTLELCRELPVLLPPRHVQRDLSQRLRSKIERGEGAAECLRKQLLTLKEYRQSLITAAVTGQLEIPTEDYE